MLHALVALHCSFREDGVPGGQVYYQNVKSIIRKRKENKLVVLNLSKNGLCLSHFVIILRHFVITIAICKKTFCNKLLSPLQLTYHNITININITIKIARK